MKKIFKFILFIFIFNFIIGFGIISYASISIIRLSFKDTGIKITDLVKPHLSQEKAAKLEKNLNCNAAAEGTKLAKNAENIILKLLPNKNFDYSKLPSSPYPYKDPTSIVNKASNEGLETGLDILKNSEH